MRVGGARRHLPELSVGDDLVHAHPGLAALGASDGAARAIHERLADMSSRRWEWGVGGGEWGVVRSKW